MGAGASSLSGSIAWPCWVALVLTVGLTVAWLSRRRPRVATFVPDAPEPRAEAQLQELRETVDELTRARAAAVEAADRRDEFLATLSHELRSPLNAILGWTQVLEPRRDLPAEVADALRVIRRNALRQRQLLDDIADMSRVVTGAVAVDPRPMSVRDAVEEACQAVHPELERKGVRLTCQADTTACIAGDPRRMQQVFWNLLANAARFTPAGGAITVDTSERDGEVTIAVRDTGEGIEAEFLPHVFEPFRQQPRSLPRDHASFGLGLALVRIIVAAHSGRVSAHSDGPGQGSVFSVTLPILAADGDASLPRAIAADGPAPASAAPLAGVRVLAVDDEPDWCDLLARILASAGADARVARSAAEGLRIYDEWRPDVLLTDIAMPGTDGYDLLAAIRSRMPGGSVVPALAMTAHAGAQERTRTARAGFVEHLAKPIPPQELIESLRRVAEQLPGRGERGPSG